MARDLLTCRRNLFVGDLFKKLKLASQIIYLLYFAFKLIFPYWMTYFLSDMFHSQEKDDPSHSSQLKQ